MLIQLCMTPSSTYLVAVRFQEFPHRGDSTHQVATICLKHASVRMHIYRGRSEVQVLPRDKQYVWSWYRIQGLIRRQDVNGTVIAAAISQATSHWAQGRVISLSLLPAPCF
ncbi:hypothetical protein KCU66_g21, partial [Aureobasidium melanogenum]